MTTLSITSVPAVGVSALDAPSGRVLLALLPLFVLAVALVAYCLADLARVPSTRYLPKPVWALVILLFSVPLGAIGYLLLGRDRRPVPRDPVADDAGSCAGDQLPI